ncbi:MAG TPA: dsDNA nuclease domain-containing protein [Solirubrobacteraceae bacterium]|jgi:hypothetical protein|nr:dsDNA nuclease domain-containing protein [Solirubrobacteraceae bacterium]
MQQQPLGGPTLEDAGATTAGRYRFQYCCVGARLLAAIAERQACVVICERHEDYLVLVEDGRMQACVKHREGHLATWSVPSLAGADGNLGHLLDTFQRANGQIDCCFESNRAHRVGGLFSEDAAVDSPLRDDRAEAVGDAQGGRCVRRAPDDPAADAESARHREHVRDPVRDGCSGRARDHLVTVGRDLDRT